MSKSLDKLGTAVSNVIKDSAGSSITKDQLVDMIDDNIGFLHAASLFFQTLGDDNAKMKEYIDTNRKNTKAKSIAYFNKMVAGLNGSAQRAMTDRFLGAMVDTCAGLTLVLEDVSINIDKLFADKAITVYNTKISQVAIFGMLESARMFSEFVTSFIAVLNADRSDVIVKPAPYVFEFIDANIDDAISLMNRTINNKMGKTFTAAIIKYRNGGADINIANSDNKPTVHFAKINGEVTENDIAAGARGIAIFRHIGNWLVDMADKKLRKLRAQRELLQARARALQLELDGVDPNSPEYQKVAKIIANYQKMIDRLNQEIAKSEQKA